MIRATIAQRRFAFASAAEIERAQSRRLRASIAHSYEHVPYYRETMARLGLTPADFGKAADLARLPLIERRQLQADPEYFVSDVEPIETYAQLRSAGSTGEPITVFRDRFSMLMTAALEERFRSLIRRLTGRLIHRQAGIGMAGSASTVFGETRRNASLIPRDPRVRRLRLDHMAPIADNLARINEFRPDVIGCTGAYVQALFSHIRTTGAEFVKPKVVVYVSDAVPDAIRRLVDEDFGIHLISAYAAIEAWQIGFECERYAGHHLNCDVSPVRIVDSNGQAVPEGESGEVVVSDLSNRATVLLNYRLGDLARQLPGRCACGRNLPMLSLLEGRMDDRLIGSDGELIHARAVHAALKPERDLWGFQIVQEGRDALSVALVAAPGCDRDGVGDRVGRRLSDLVGHGGVRVSFVDSLPRTARGKIRPVVSLVGDGIPGNSGSSPAVVDAEAG